MPHGPEEHLEHAEHAQHAAHDPFNRRVAMTMTIVAASLACVTMLGHRAHNETLRLTTHSNILHTQESDAWNFYQAKNIRRQERQANIVMLEVLAVQPGKEQDRDKAIKKWSEQVAKYQKELPEMKADAERLQKEGKRLHEEATHCHHRADRFDYGELSLQMALILCSIAILTKQPGFWFGGMSFGVLGIGLAVFAFFIH